MLNRAGGWMAGVPVYLLAKAACHVANIGRPRQRLDADAASLMRGYLPDVDYDRVRCCFGASLPANWLPGGIHGFSAEGMTFGDTMFFRGSGYTASRTGLSLLLHELVHVDQVRRAGGEIAFACQYGRGFLSGGGYRMNPLEIEAYDLVARCAASLPDGLRAAGAAHQA